MHNTERAAVAARAFCSRLKKLLHPLPQVALLIAYCLLPIASALAQTTVSVSGTLGSLANPTQPSTFLRLKLIGCANGDARVDTGSGINTAVAIPSDYAQDLLFSATGSFSGTVYPNSAIYCNGKLGTTRYLLTVYVSNAGGSHPAASGPIGAQGTPFFVGPGAFALGGASANTDESAGAFYLPGATPIELTNNAGTLNANGSPIGGGAVASVFGQTGAIPNLSGDATTSGSSAVTVIKVNGAALPASAAVLGTNGSNQPIAATTTGSGTTVPLATGPTLIAPKIDQTNDTVNNLPVVKYAGVASAVDQITQNNSATGTHKVLSQATGTDSNIDYEIDAKGSGNLDLGSANTTVDPSGNIVAVGETLTGNVNFSAATHTQPLLKGLTASKPVTCTQGELYFATDATAGQQIFECSSANTWTQQLAGSGSPGGASTTLQFNNSGSFGGILNSGVDNSMDASAASRYQITLVPTYTVGNAANAVHGLNVEPTYTGSQGMGTFSGTYTFWHNGGTGAIGHALATVSRVDEHSTGGATQATEDNYYADQADTGTGINPVTDRTSFHSAAGTVTGATAAYAITNYNGFWFQIPTVTTATIASMNGVKVQLPGSSNSQIASFVGVAAGACNESSTYDALVACGGRSLFSAPVKVTINAMDTAPSAPMTTTDTTAFTVTGTTVTNTTDIAIKAFMQDNQTTGNTVSDLIGVDSTANAGNSGTTSNASPFKSHILNSTGTITNAIGYEVGSPTNNSGGTIVNIAGVQIDNQTPAGTVTNAPLAINQLGSGDINQFAGVTYLNGNRCVLTSDFTTAANTSLQNIGCAFTFPKNTPVNIPFSCTFRYSQATAAAANSWGIQFSANPTSASANAITWTSTSAATAGNLQGLASTTATAMGGTFTPSAITTVWNASISGVIRIPSQAATTVNFMAATGNASDLLTVKADSGCSLGSF